MAENTSSKPKRYVQMHPVFTDELKEKFLEALAKEGLIRTACATIHVSRETIRVHQNKDAKFAEAILKAKADHLRPYRVEAQRRAIDGVITETIYNDQGVIIREKRTFSDPLLIKLLTRHDKDMVERTESKSEVNVKGEGNMAIRRELDLKAEFGKLDKAGIAAMEIVVKQLEDAAEEEDAA